MLGFNQRLLLREKIQPFRKSQYTSFTWNVNPSDGTASVLYPSSTKGSASGRGLCVIRVPSARHPPPLHPRETEKGIPTGVAPLINHCVPAWLPFQPQYQGASHMLAQPVKRCSASCIKPDKTSNLQKRQNILCFWSVWEKGFLYVVAKWRAKFQKPWEISLSYSFAVEMGFFDTVRWKYHSVGISSMSWNRLEQILWKKADEKCKDQKRGIFLRRMLW